MQFLPCNTMLSRYVPVYTIFTVHRGKPHRNSWDLVSSAEREPITGVYASPQRDPGADSLVWGQGDFYPLSWRQWSANKAQIYPFFCYFVNCSKMFFERILLRFLSFKHRTTELFRVWNRSVVRNLFQIQLDAWLQYRPTFILTKLLFKVEF